MNALLLDTEDNGAVGTEGQGSKRRRLLHACALGAERDALHGT